MPRATVPLGSHPARPLVALLVANTVSQVGNAFSAIAVAWFVLAETGSAAQTGVVVAVGTLPVIIVGIFGGAVVDRLGYRTTSVVSDVASGVTTALIPLLHITVGIAFWQLLALVFLGGLLDGPGRTARLAVYPDLIRQAGTPRDRANALYQLTNRVAQVGGPPLAGLLLVVISPTSLLWVNAATFAVSAVVIVAALPADRRERTADAAAVATGRLRAYAAEVAEGFRFIRADWLLVWVVGAFSVGGLLAEPVYQIIFPVYAREVFDSPAPLGFIYAALGAGSIVGNLIYVALVGRLTRRAILFGGFGIRAACFATLLVMPPAWLIVGAIFLCAVAFEPINPMTMSLMQERVPDRMRGRIFGAWGAIGASTLPLGILAYGALMEWFGLAPTLAVFVGLNLALPLGMTLVPALRRLADAPAGDGAPRPAEG